VIIKTKVIEVKNKKAKIQNLLKEAKKELTLFKEKGKFTNLSQACEKTWVAFVLMLEYISRRELKNNISIKNIAYTLGMGELYQRARYLHIIHYEGSPDVSFRELSVEIEETIDDIEKLFDTFIIER